jgi:hypothetical protein
VPFHVLRYAGTARYRLCCWLWVLMKRGSDVAALIPSRAGVECSVVVLEGLGPWIMALAFLVWG